MVSLLFLNIFLGILNLTNSLYLGIGFFGLCLDCAERRGLDIQIISQHQKHLQGLYCKGYIFQPVVECLSLPVSLWYLLLGHSLFYEETLKDLLVTMGDYYVSSTHSEAHLASAIEILSSSSTCNTNGIIYNWKQQISEWIQNPICLDRQSSILSPNLEICTSATLFAFLIACQYKIKPYL